MVSQELMCWASNEGTNKDHHYHTFEDCHSVQRIKDHGNLITMTVGEAQKRRLPHCTHCQSRS